MAAVEEEEASRERLPVGQMLQRLIPAADAATDLSASAAEAVPAAEEALEESKEESIKFYIEIRSQSVDISKFEPLNASIWVTVPSHYSTYED